ncbi:hypothetical protein [Streptomyces griseosporeus]|uniref:hypothetical protein n=1 Tax=Streptomyces griseosporeus TaxID=1910 RepID=UPI0036952346
MEQSGTSALLQGVVQDLASGVAAALRGGGPAVFPGGVPPEEPPDGILIAAVRVLGADLLLPHVLLHTPPAEREVTLLRRAVDAFPPAADAAPTVRWSHWGMSRGLHTVEARYGPAGGGPGAEPDAGWLDETSWQALTHRLAVLAALAVPGEDCALARGAQRRVVDVGRGFVRAVRRRDWRQAAGAGRWLAVLDGVPATLGLDAGLDFVELMGGTDPVVDLQVRAARLIRAGVPV